MSRSKGQKCKKSRWDSRAAPSRSAVTPLNETASHGRRELCTLYSAQPLIIFLLLLSLLLVQNLCNCTCSSSAGLTNQDITPKQFMFAGLRFIRSISVEQAVVMYLSSEEGVDRARILAAALLATELINCLLCFNRRIAFGRGCR